MLTIHVKRVSADGDNVVNTTNVAIKGIIALKAMAEISRALGKDADADTYQVGIVVSLFI